MKSLFEQMGIVGPADGAKPREVRLTKAQLLERRAYMQTPSERQSGNGGE